MTAPQDPPPRSLSAFLGRDPARRRRAILALAGIGLVLIAFFGITIAVLLATGRSLEAPPL